MPKKLVAQGIFYLAIGQALFIIFGYALHVSLGRILGPSSYGLFGFIISLLVWSEIVLGGVSGAATKKVSESPVTVRIVAKKAIFLQLLTGATLLVIAFLFSPFLAGIFNDSRTSFYFKIAILDIPVFALFSLHIGLLNGLRSYKEQAMTTATYSFFKLTFVVALVFMGFSIAGALIGNIMASFFGFITGFYFFRKITGFIRFEGNKSPIKSFDLLKSGLPFTIIGILFNLIMSVDLWFVKGMILEAPKVGYYVAAGTLAKVLYFLFSALSSALFPAITSSIAEARSEQTRRYINQALRFLFIFLVPISLIIAVTSSGLVTLVYSGSYLPASSPLAILGFGYAFISILLAIVYILMANNNFKEVAIFALILVLLDIGLCASLIPRYGLNGAALATTITCLLGSLTGAVLLWRNFTTLVAPKSLLKILIASLTMTLIFIEIPAKGVYLILLYILGALTYFGLLMMLKEIKKEDVLVLKQLITGA